MAGGFERSEHRSSRGARQIGHRGEIFPADVDLDRGGAGRRLSPAPAEAQQHCDGAFDVIADQQIVRGADGDVVVRDRREAEESPSAGVSGDNLPDRGQGQMQQFRIRE